MINKLKSQYINATTTTNPYHLDFFLDYHWFRESHSDHWLGIPKHDVTLPELTLLKTLFEYYSALPRSISRPQPAERWYRYLFQSGPNPSNEDKPIRISHFSYVGEETNPIEIQAALAGFFSTNYILVWLNTYSGLIIEDRPQLFDVDFISISSTLEAEFFIKPYFFVGKKRPISEDFLRHFQAEMTLFETGKKLLPTDRVLTFEKIFPHLITKQLSKELQNHIQRELFLTFSEEPDLLITVKTYLEANFNLTITAKNLYIHRNTLQYRLDKFVEKTGINLKSFSGALTVYLACILHN
jgi:hypothetical protein